MILVARLNNLAQPHFSPINPQSQSIVEPLKTSLRWNSSSELLDATTKFLRQGAVPAVAGSIPSPCATPHSSVTGFAASRSKACSGQPRRIGFKSAKQGILPSILGFREKIVGSNHLNIWSGTSIFEGPSSQNVKEFQTKIKKKHRCNMMITWCNSEAIIVFWCILGSHYYWSIDGLLALPRNLK